MLFEKFMGATEASLALGVHMMLINEHVSARDIVEWGVGYLTSELDLCLRCDPPGTDGIVATALDASRRCPSYPTLSSFLVVPLSHSYAIWEVVIFAVDWDIHRARWDRTWADFRLLFSLNVARLTTSCTSLPTAERNQSRRFLLCFGR